MSLLNDALKKAQRQRAEEQAGFVPTEAPAGGRVAKRRQPMRTQTVIMVGVGVAALLAVGAVGAFFLMERPAKTATSVTKPAPPPANPAVKILSDSETTSNSQKPITDATGTTGTRALDTGLNPAGVAGEGTTPVSSLSIVIKDSAPTSAAPVPSERVQAFVDAIRVTGIRSSGNESKVLMNDRVFRINEVVDRSLELRLTDVAQNTLTFTDANGAVYVKQF